MDTVKRKNHEATRSYIELWQSSNGLDRGVWSLQLAGLSRKNQVLPVFEQANPINSKGIQKSPVRFAIRDFLYVPVGVDDARDDELENKFGEYESQMIAFCRASVKGICSSGKAENVVKGLVGCLTHSVRDFFGWDALHSLIQKNGFSEKASNFEPKVHRKLVHNAYCFIEEYTKLVRTWSWTVLWNLPHTLVTCDRPCWDLRFTKDPEDIVYMPLSPTTLLMGIPEKSPKNIVLNLGYVDSRNAGQQTIDKWNHMTTERARSWIVGDSCAVLNNLMPLLTPQLYASRVATDTPRFRSSV